MELFHLTAKGPLSQFESLCSCRDAEAGFSKFLSADESLLDPQLRDQDWFEPLSSLFFSTSLRYVSAVARCQSMSASAEPAIEPARYVLGLCALYNRSGLLDLKFPEDMDERFSKEDVVRWRAALSDLCSQLRPTFSAVLYLHGIVARMVLDHGFQQFLMTREVFSDLLVLNTLALNAGGAHAFLYRLRSAEGVTKFVKEYVDARITIQMTLREMFVNHNRSMAFSHAVFHGGTF